MKKQLIKCLMLCTVMLVCISMAHAQTKFLGTKTNPTGVINNTAADTLLFTFSQPTYSEVLTIQPTVFKATGTMAGKVVMYASTLTKDSVQYFIPTGDTLFLTSATSQTGIFVKSKPGYRSYMAIYSGGTSVTGNFTAYLNWLIPR